MSRFVEPKEIASKVDKARTLLEYVSESGTSLMRDSSIRQYEDILDMLHDCENILSGILNAQRIKHAAPSMISSQSFHVILNQPKDIMRAYRSRMSDLRVKKFSISAVSSCAVALYDWFNLRFKSAEESSFRYNPSKICNYIDEFIVAYGYYVRNKSISEFNNSMYEWGRGIDAEGSVQYPLPKFIHDIYQSSDNIEAEAVVLEKEIKSSLYDSNFNEDKIDTIFNMYTKIFPDHTYEIIKMRSKL